MKYSFIQNGIEIIDKSEFNPKHILECGQVFRYQSERLGYKIWAKNSVCYLICEKEHDIISTNHREEFVHFFDLDRNYSEIKKNLLEFPFMKNAIEHGYGIRILNQDPFEMVLSFIISSNNNIPRIKGIIERLCERCGETSDCGLRFPSPDKLRNKGISFFQDLGAGYRAKYLYDTIDAINNGFSLDIQEMSTINARKHLMRLTGVGRKVADCVLLFGYHKTDVFPTDTWIDKIYVELFGENNLSREQKADYLSDYYGDLSGYAQQYLFYKRRSGNKIKLDCISED